MQPDGGQGEEGSVTMRGVGIFDVEVGPSSAPASLMQARSH